MSKWAYSTVNASQIVIMYKSHMTVRRLLCDHSYSGVRTHNDPRIDSPRQYISTEREGDPDISEISIYEERQRMIAVTYIGVGRDAYAVKTRVRFRFRFMPIGTGFRHCLKPWPNVQNAGDAVPSNEYALILGQILAYEELGS